MTGRGLRGRADLARILSSVEPPDRDRLARVLGYDRADLPEPLDRTSETLAVGGPSLPEMSIEERPLVDVPFYYASRFTPRDPPTPSERTEETLAPVAYSGWRERPATLPPYQALAPWRLLEPQLRACLAPETAGHEIDTDQAIGRLARAEMLERLPGRPRRRWARRLRVVWDRSLHLVPYWLEQEVVTGALRRLLPYSEIERVVLDAASGTFRLAERSGQPRIDLEAVAEPVLVLGDLGVLGAEAKLDQERWLRLAERFGRGQAMALCPLDASLFPADLRHRWTILRWDEAPAGPIVSLEEQRAMARRLLRLVSPAVRLEPGLLRAVRKALLPEAPASVEALAWQSRSIEHGSTVAATFDAERRKALRAAFDREPEDLRAQALELIRAWHAEQHEAIWFEELMDLPAGSRHLVPEADREDARAYFVALCRRRRLGGREALGDRLRAWLGRVGGRTEAAWQDAAFREVVWSVKRHDPTFTPPVAPGVLPVEGRGVGNIAVAQCGDRLGREAGTTTAGSLLGLLPSDDGLVELTRDESWRAIWGEERPPDWVSAFGEDQYGKWLAFEVDGITQRLRWIPPGSFLMGSPPYEPGRFDREGPQHEVTFAKGSWLFDTPVTQALWQAVMGGNPSRFKSPDRPVERVSWDDVQRFLKRLNGLGSGLELELPSEAEWEYACRAGTETATYAGELSDGALDEIAWYAENSGRETHPVGLKAANFWGLYDMLGNVWEWCADNWHASYEGAAADGSARVEASSESGERARVVRGGSWGDRARSVRAAYRSGRPQGGRDDSDLGFRCARGRIVSSGRPEAVATAAAGRGAEPRPAAADAAARQRGSPLNRGMAGIASVRVATGGAAAYAPLPPGPFVLRSDRAELAIARLVKADVDWATALGRDRFGLWADLGIEGVTQRLRWIPPGRFVMGSPESEAGRWEAEGPQHAVTIGEGFWLFDTPVTQALWVAVMGDNPSEFKSPDRPVERVSFDDVQGFLDRVNERVPGLGLVLPSEAQWEYACRAGTETAIWTGPLAILGERNAPGLDPIAWYCGNSGDGFELDNGFDSSVWEEKQYSHAKSGTRPVGLKAANPWGLYDMLANVWEWCADDWHDSYEGAPTDGRAWLVGASESGERRRVVRGGSWFNLARSVRAACRDGVPEGYQYASLGFRCAQNYLVEIDHSKIEFSAPNDQRPENTYVIDSRTASAYERATRDPELAKKIL